MNLMFLEQIKNQMTEQYVASLGAAGKDIQQKKDLFFSASSPQNQFFLLPIFSFSCTSAAQQYYYR